MQSVATLDDVLFQVRVCTLVAAMALCVIAIARGELVASWSSPEWLIFLEAARKWCAC